MDTPRPDSLPAQAQALVEASREASRLWAAKPASERSARLMEAGKVLLDGAEELAQLIAEETGKPLGEAYAGDVLGVADLFSYWCKHGPALLAPRRAKIPALDMPGKRGWIEREARGVVAVISPWNYPVALPMRVIVPALLAGNGVVLKPSEHTSRSGRWVIDTLRAQLGPIVAVLEGAGEAGAALIGAKPDMVHFTGSTVTGRKVAIRCAELGVPCEMELGGKDCAVVLPDAQLERTAAGIAWGIVHNAGQDCAGIERVLVHADVADAFLPVLVDKMRAAAKSVPHLVTPMQRDIVVAQLTEALSLGARATVGGVPEGDAAIAPTLLMDVPRDAAAWRDESFGPIAVVEVHSTEQALVDAANDCVYGLGASVWSKDVARAEALGRRVNTGMLWVNNHAFTGAVPDLPWVGRGASGSGITSSPESLDHLTRPRVVVIDRSSALEPWWYPYGESLVDLMRALIVRQRTGGLGATLATLGKLSARNRDVKGG